MGVVDLPPLFLKVHVMDIDERINELLDKEDFGVDDYNELLKLISEKEKEYYSLRERFRKAMLNA